MKAKTEPATTRIMRLLDRLSAYSFNLYYVKGRDMILSDYLSRHRQKDLDPSELKPISFCCLKTYRSLIDDRIGEEIFCIKARASAKASGKTVGEVHGADKPLDPNYKPEHQSKSTLPSVTGKLSPEKVIRKPISQTPSGHTPRKLITPKSVRIQSKVVSDMTNPDSNSTPKRTPIMVHGGAKPKTPMMVKTPLAPSTRPPLTPPHTHLQIPPYVPRKFFSSTPPEISEKNMNIQDPAFTSSLMEAFVTQLNIKIVLVSPTNHQSLQAEHGIKSLSGLLVKHLSTVWSWHSVLPYGMLCYNGYSSPNLNGYSPYELVFGHKMTLLHELEIKVDTIVSGTFKDYYEKLKKNLQYMGERLQKFRSQRLDLLNKDREYQAFEVGQIVYMFQARDSVVETGSRKIRCNYIGPLVIFKAVGLNQFLPMSLDGLVYPHLIEQSRLKAGPIWTTKGNVNNLADLRKALSTGLSIGAN